MAGFFSLSMFSGFMHVVACTSTSFLFMAEKYSIVGCYHIWFTHLSGDGYLGCSYLLAVMSNAAINILRTSVCVDIYGTPLQYSCLENPMDRGAW